MRGSSVSSHLASHSCSQERGGGDLVLEATDLSYLMYTTVHGYVKVALETPTKNPFSLLFTDYSQLRCLPLDASTGHHLVQVDGKTQGGSGENRLLMHLER